MGRDLRVKNFGLVGEPKAAIGVKKDNDDDHDGNFQNNIFVFSCQNEGEDGEPGGANGAEKEDDDDDGKDHN